MTSKNKKIQLGSMIDPLEDMTSSGGPKLPARRAPKNKRKAQEYRSTNVKTSVLALGSKDSHELLNVTAVRLEDIQRMLERDGQVSSAWRTIVAPLKNLGFSVRQWEDPNKEEEDPPEPPPIDPLTGLPKKVAKKKKPKDKRGLEEMRFIRDMFTQPTVNGGMNQSFKQFVEEILLALRDGFACFEKVWRVDDGKWVIDRFAYIPSREVRFVVDSDKKLEEVRQYRNRFTRRQSEAYIQIPANKLFLFTIGHADNPFYGKSTLLPAYYHYDKKHKLYYIMHLAYALNAIAARVGTYPRRATQEDIDRFEQDLAAFGTNASIVVPEGYNITAFQQTRGLADLMPAITHHDQQITKSLLPHMIGVGIQPTPIGDDKGFLKLFEIYLNGIMSEIAEAINRHIIPELVQYNFGTKFYPTIAFDSIPLDRIQLAQEVFTRLISTKSVAPSAEFLQKLERVLSERMGLEIDYSNKPPDEFRPPDVNVSGGSPNALPGQGRPRKGTNEPISTDPKERSKQDQTRRESAAKLESTDDFIEAAIGILKDGLQQIKESME